MTNPNHPVSNLINEQLLRSKETCPEAVDLLPLLYLPVLVNNFALRALVDCGSSRTVISTAVAQKTGLIRYLDSRFQSTLKGLGEAPILGVVYNSPIQMGSKVFRFAYAVSEFQPNAYHDIVLGLDFMLKHSVTVDAAAGYMEIDGESVSFMTAQELENSIKLGVSYTTLLPKVVTLHHDNPNSSNTSSSSGPSQQTAGGLESALPLNSNSQQTGAVPSTSNQNRKRKISETNSSSSQQLPDKGGEKSTETVQPPQKHRKIIDLTRDD